MARIIILNGVGSAGKSSIAHALQDIVAKPYLHVAMDAFLDMLPEAYWDHPDGFRYEPVLLDGEPATAIRTGAGAEQALRGMRRAMLALAAEGNNLIIDDVMLGSSREEYKNLFSGFDVSLVGVFAPLPVLEERERNRKDRTIGLARWQYDRVHAGLKYDLEIDTSIDTPVEAARKIKDRFEL